LSPQFLVDGLVAGACIGLGAIGVTLVYSILRFSNFAHGEYMSWGAYGALTVSGALGWLVPGLAVPLDPLSFGWSVVIGLFVAMAATALLALALDFVLFRRLRRQASSITIVMASFGASMALRALLEFLFTSRPAYFTPNLQIAMRLNWGIRITPDQIALMVLAVILSATMHGLMTRTRIGLSMQAVSENPQLARVVGIDADEVIRWTWIIGAALACASGTMVGLLIQIRPQMGFDLLLPLFAAAILGGIGSVPGAMVGGLLVGLAEAAAVQWVGAEWRAAVAFLVIILVLLVRPTGLFGRRA